MNILIGTHPFGQCGELPVKLLKETGWNIKYNPLGRRLEGDEVKGMLKGIDAVIAGTEPYNKDTIQYAKDLKVISRAGVGLDSVDCEACKQNRIQVAYTPEAPSDSVADLTIAQIFNLLRGLHLANQSAKDGEWERILGLSIKQINVGILGVGRIGGRVINRLKPFGANILACDIAPNKDIDGVTWVDKEVLFAESDLISIHIPLNEENYHFISSKEFDMMKKGAYIINTSRGSIIRESDLESCLANNHLAGAALDVFENEPYSGVMQDMDNVILTAHLGASDRRSKYLMELGAVENCVNLLSGNIIKDIVI
jgi:D-3-phosphoglycerate dehydrogenase / 2-oxoglutarate reductase